MSCYCCVRRSYSQYLSKQYKTLLDQEDKSHDDEIVRLKVGQTREGAS
jgi:hypothetical protein